MSEMFSGVCNVRCSELVCDSLFKRFEAAAELSEEELRAVFDQLDVDGEGTISAAGMQSRRNRAAIAHQSRTNRAPIAHQSRIAIA